MPSSPSSPHRNSPCRHSNEESNRKQRRKRGEKRRRPLSGLSSPATAAACPAHCTDKNCVYSNHHGESSSSPSFSKMPSCLSDPYGVIAAAVDHDESKRNGLEILQVPLETGKLYHNEKLFFRALDHLRKESRSFRFGWSRPLPLPKTEEEDENNNNGDPGQASDSQQQQSRTILKKNRRSARSLAVTPIILSGILASLEVDSVTKRKPCSNPNCTNSVCASTTNTAQASSPTSAELVNYTVGMRRAALTRVRLRMKRDRAQRIAKPILAIVTVIGLYFYAWSNLQLFLVGFYGVTSFTHAPPPDERSGPILVTENLARLVTSSCRTRANGDHYGYLNDYSKACRVAEARAFELSTSTHNHRHTRLFASKISKAFADELYLDTAVTAIGDEATIQKLASSLMQYDDEYGEDKDLPLYAMHTPLGDEESSIIPLEDVIHGKRRKQGERKQRQRWKRRRRRMQKHKQKEREANSSESDPSDDNSSYGENVYESVSLAFQFWGDTTVNRLVREAIVEAHYPVKAQLSSSPTAKTGKTKPTKNKDNQDKNDELKILDVGSGLSGTLFSLFTPEFPFRNWSYHGIAISQPEVRRAKQLVETALAPILPSSSSSSSTKGDTESNDVSNGSENIPLTNVTIQQSSFDDPLPPEEYTTMIAIESLVYSHNITKTLINLARSLKPKGTLIIIDDVVAPWAAADRTKSGDEITYIQGVAEKTGRSSLLTHEEWLEGFAAAGLTLHRPARDLLLEFDSWPIETTSAATAATITGLPFVGVLLGHRHRPWYTTGHGILNLFIYYFRGSDPNVTSNHSGDDNTDDDDGNLSNRALRLMEDMMQNDRGNAYRKAAYNRADLGYYMYVCTKE